MTPALTAYFEHPNAPRMNSPIGELMARIEAKFPLMSFEDARAKAKQLLTDAAGKKNWRMPAVLTDQEAADQRERIRNAFKKPLAA